MVVAPGSSRTPRASVVTALFNLAAEIGPALESILAQDFDDFEVIVVDDGSSDGGPEVVRKLADRVKLIEQPNRGAAAARNVGARAARGALVCYCDGDDLQLPFRIAAQVSLLDRFPEAALVFSDLKTWTAGEVKSESHLRARWLGPSLLPFDQEIRAAFQRSWPCSELGLPVPAEYADRRIYLGRVAPLIALMHVAWGGVSMARRDLVLAAGGMWEAVRAYEDWALASELSKRHPLVFMDLPTMLYRIHPGQLTGRPRLNTECYLKVIEHCWRGDRAFYAEHHELVDRVHGTAFALLGEIEAAENNWAQAERYFANAIRTWPRFVRTYPNLALSTIRHRLPFLRGTLLDRLLPRFLGPKESSR